VCSTRLRAESDVNDCLFVACSAAAASSNVASVDALAASQSLPPKEQPETLPELTFSYELQQGYRILRELTTDSNKSFVGPFVNPIDPSSPDYVEYHKRIKQPVWLKQSKLMKLLKTKNLMPCGKFI